MAASKFIVKFEAMIEVKDAAAARAAAQKLNVMLGNPLLRSLLESDGIVLKGTRVDPTPYVVK